MVLKDNMDNACCRRAGMHIERPGKCSAANLGSMPGRSPQFVRFEVHTVCLVEKRSVTWGRRSSAGAGHRVGRGGSRRAGAERRCSGSSRQRHRYMRWEQASSGGSCGVCQRVPALAGGWACGRVGGETRNQQY